MIKSRDQLGPHLIKITEKIHDFWHYLCKIFFNNIL